LVSGLFYASISSKIGIIYLIGRQLYAYGYQKGGAKHPIRSVGALMLDVRLL